MRTALLVFILIIGIACGVVAGERHPAEVRTVTAWGEASVPRSMVLGRMDGDQAALSDVKEKAIADALRNAVMSTLGVFVDATTVGQNYSVVRDEIILRASGFAVVDKVESISVVDNIFRVKVTASVSTRPLAQRLKELGLTHEWKVGVYIPETYTSKPNPIPDPAAETAVIQQLLKMGFRVLDENQRHKLEEDETARRASEGDAAALKSIKREYDVDIFITGEALAEYVDESNEGGVTVYRSRGRIEAKAYYTDTAEIIAIDDASADGFEQTEYLSAKQCFKKMGDLAGKRVAEDILIVPAALTPFVTVKITNLSGINAASSVQKALNNLPGVTRVKRDRYASGVLELNVYVKSEFRDELPENLEKCAVAKKLGLSIDLWTRTYVQGRVL